MSLFIAERLIQNLHEVSELARLAMSFVDGGSEWSPLHYPRKNAVCSRLSGHPEKDSVFFRPSRNQRTCGKRSLCFANTHWSFQNINAGSFRF